jgi:hypothetical protein
MELMVKGERPWRPESAPQLMRPDADQHQRHDGWQACARDLAMQAIESGGSSGHQSELVCSYDWLTHLELPVSRDQRLQGPAETTQRRRWRRRSVSHVRRLSQRPAWQRCEPCRAS